VQQLNDYLAMFFFKLWIESVLQHCVRGAVQRNFSIQVDRAMLWMKKVCGRNEMGSTD
jgi:hypothetical protein